MFLLKIFSMGSIKAIWRQALATSPKPTTKPNTKPRAANGAELWTIASDDRTEKKINFNRGSITSAAVLPARLLTNVA